MSQMELCISEAQYAQKGENNKVIIRDGMQREIVNKIPDTNEERYKVLKEKSLWNSISKWFQKNKVDN